MPQLFSNNAASILNGAIAPGTLAITLAAGEGARFPAPSAGDWFTVTLYQRAAGVEVNHEIVKCTARAGDVLTVARAQEGTTARAFGNGDFVELRPTAGGMQATVTDLAAAQAAIATKAAQADLTATNNVVATKAAQTDLAAALVTLATKANSADVTAAIAQAKAELVNSSPAALDTLKELSDALGNDANFSTTITTALGNRVRVDAAQAFTAPQKAQAATNLGLPNVENKSSAMIRGELTTADVKTALAASTDFRMGTTASAVNYVSALGGVTGTALTTGAVLSTDGTDADVSLVLKTKGQGHYRFLTNGVDEQFRVAALAGAVNYVQARGSVSGGVVTINAQGMDADVGIRNNSKGTGSVQMATGGYMQLNASCTVNAVNYVNVTGGATGTGVFVSAQGTDANIDLNLAPKGTGGVKLTNAVITGYIETYQSPVPGSAVTLDPTVGTLIEIATTGNCTVTLPAPVAGRSYTLMVTFGGAHTVTFVGGGTLRWMEGGTAPTMTSVAGKTDILSFLCNATKTFGRTGGKNG